ncbi:uncharacterized protein DUF1364 [Paraburkholderia sp. BL8N3]|nr:uncharacterized protein DUF1364 [Paraburkholderia sp. BL8N3]
MKRSAPMKRTGFQRKPGSPFSSLANAKTALRRTAMKRRIKKPTVAEGSKYLAACRDEPCYLRVFEVCCGLWDTVVPCHSNESAHGKGMGLKADNRFTVPGCMTCHRWLDQSGAPHDLKFGTFRSAYARWEPVRARKMGLNEVITDEA